MSIGSSAEQYSVFGYHNRINFSNVLQFLSVSGGGGDTSRGERANGPFLPKKETLV